MSAAKGSRLFAGGLAALVCAVVVPLVFLSALLGASNAATCGAATPASLEQSAGPDPASFRAPDSPDLPPLEIARRVYAVAQSMEVDDRGVITAYVVVMVEAGGGVTMRNTKGGDAESTGAFQQQPFPEWTPNGRNRNNVSAAATTFFEHYLKIDHSLSVGVIAQTIQRSRFPNRYALAVPGAKRFLAQVKGAPLGETDGLGSITGAQGSSCGGGAAGPIGPPGQITKNNDLVPPDDAPPEIVKVIEAANRINDTPYVWGGGHGGYGLVDGYDCSGSVSYALHLGGFLPGAPLTSGPFGGWGDPGKGNWITLYSSGEHVFMFVAGTRFDTSPWGDTSGSGPRWRKTPRSLAGFTVTHPHGF